MKLKQTILSLTLILSASIGLSFATLPAYAECDSKVGPDCCAGVSTAIVHCDQTGQGTSAKDSGLWGILLIVLNILTGGIGIAAVGGIIYGAILYTSAGDRADQVKKAVSIITNVVIGVIAYGLMYVLLNFLIPGGVFS